jgi:hypothetical protein
VLVEKLLTDNIEPKWDNDGDQRSDDDCSHTIDVGQEVHEEMNRQDINLQTKV